MHLKDFTQIKKAKSGEKFETLSEQLLKTALEHWEANSPVGLCKD